MRNRRSLTRYPHSTFARRRTTVSVTRLRLPSAAKATHPRRFKATRPIQKALAGSTTRFHTARGGGQHPTFLRRSDCLNLLKVPKPPSHQLACCLGMVQGFRPGELRHARFTDLDVESGVLYVRDSKTRKIQPLRMYAATAYAYDRCPRPAGLILKRHRRYHAYDGPLSYTSLEKLVRTWARNADIHNWRSWNPTMLRKFFAKEWHRRRADDTMLRKVMRHRSLATTVLYLDSIVFVEDIPDAMGHLAGSRTPLPMLEDIEDE